jgi:uncharacterized protein
MIHLTRKLVRRWMGVLLHIDDTPSRTAAAFALGVFFAFSPVLGLHTILALGIAFLLNYNRVAVLLGVYSNLPWIAAEYYSLTTVLIGSPITHTPIPPEFGARAHALFEHSVLSSAFWHGLATLVRPMLWPYVVGSSIGALVLAALAYPLALVFVTSGRRIHEIIHHEHHEHHDRPKSSADARENKSA